MAKNQYQTLKANINKIEIPSDKTEQQKFIRL